MNIEHVCAGGKFIYKINVLPHDSFWFHRKPLIICIIDYMQPGHTINLRIYMVEYNTWTPVLSIANFTSISELKCPMPSVQWTRFCMRNVRNQNSDSFRNSYNSSFNWPFQFKYLIFQIQLFQLLVRFGNSQKSWKAMQSNEHVDLWKITFKAVRIWW